MAKIRLSPFVSVLQVGSTVFVRTDLKSFVLSGSSVNEFVRRALPLLDGSRDAEAIVKAFPDYGEAGVRALLANLEGLGVIEASERFAAAPENLRQEELSAFLGSWGPDRPDMRSAFSRAHVAVLGSNDWSTAACQELVRTGVGRLTVLTGLGKDGENDPLPEDVTLLVVTAGPDELKLLTAAARIAEKRRLRYMIAHIDGLSAILGPVVVPGETACWECLRSRRLANQASFEESALLQSGLLSAEGAARRTLSPPGAVAVLAGLILGETVKLVSGYAPSQLVGRQFEFNFVTHSATRHDVIRLPWCPVCGGAASSSDQEASIGDLMSSRGPTELRANLAGWVDARNGIVRQLALNEPSPQDPHSLSTATAVITGPAVPGHRQSEPLIGSGKGTTKVAAMVGAAGEAIERYSASIYREHDLLRASPKSLGSRAFDPVSLCLYRPEQYAQPGFPYDRFDPVQEISWAQAEWLDSGDPVLVPALVTYFNYRSRAGENFCQVTSNGLAAGASFKDAALRATLELIERDAFMITWLQRRPPQRVEVGEELGVDVSEVLVELRELGMDANLYLLRGDVGIPTVMCVAWGDGKTRPAASVALAAHIDPIEAARKAVLEQAHVGPYVARMMADATQKIPKSFADVRSLNDHALFYVPRSRLRAFTFIRSSRQRAVRLSALKRPSGSGTEACVAALAGAGFRVAIADVTSPDVRLGPFRVARALGTYLQPIDFGYQRRRLANPRLGGVAVNPDPHPLA